MRELGLDDIVPGLQARGWLTQPTQPTDHLLMTQSNANVSTDLRVEFALQRFGLDADVGGVLSFAKHEDLHLTLQRAALEVPPYGYA